MFWWDQKAQDLQARVIIGEEQGVEDRSDEDVRRAQVNSRQDLVLVVSQMSSANKQLMQIRHRIEIGLVMLFVLAVIVAIKA